MPLYNAANKIPSSTQPSKASGINSAMTKSAAQSLPDSAKRQMRQARDSMVAPVATPTHTAPLADQPFKQALSEHWKQIKHDVSTTAGAFADAARMATGRPTKNANPPPKPPVVDKPPHEHLKDVSTKPPEIGRGIDTHGHTFVSERHGDWVRSKRTGQMYLRYNGGLYQLHPHEVERHYRDGMIFGRDTLRSRIHADHFTRTKNTVDPTPSATAAAIKTTEKPAEQALPMGNPATVAATKASPMGNAPRQPTPQPAPLVGKKGQQFLPIPQLSQATKDGGLYYGGPTSTPPKPIDKAPNPQPAERSPVAPVNTPKPTSAPESTGKTASVPFMVTARMRAGLKQLGHDDKAINAMTPQQAHEHLSKKNFVPSTETSTKPATKTPQATAEQALPTGSVSTAAATKTATAQPHPAKKGEAGFGTKRTYRAGQNVGSIEFPSTLVRDLFDMHSKWRNGMRQSGRASDPKSGRDYSAEYQSALKRIAATHGLDPKDVANMGFAAYGHVKANLKGFKDGEHRDIPDFQFTPPSEKTKAVELSKPSPALFEDFDKEYRAAFNKAMKYPPNTIGAREAADEMARLAEAHPEFAERSESAQENVSSPGKNAVESLSPDDSKAAVQSLMEPKKPIERNSFVPPNEIDHDEVYRVDPKHLNVDPARFQYKVKDIGEKGVTSEFSDVQSWNPLFGGTLLVWRDPSDGKDYVVNGHHRHEMATRLGAGDVAIRYINTDDPVKARSIGALVNIAEGRGTSIDAAKYMRDSGSDIDDLKKIGVSLKGKIAKDAIVLKDLNDSSFQAVAEGRLDENTAVDVARHLKDPEKQQELFRKISKRESEGKLWNRHEIETAAKKMVDAGSYSQEGGLFAMDESTFDQEVELESHVLRNLNKAASDYRAVANKKRAERVSGAGNVLQVDENAKRAKEAEGMSSVFEKFMHLKGPIADTIRQFAAELAKATTPALKNAIKQKALEAVKVAFEQETGQETSQFSVGIDNYDTDRFVAVANEIWRAA